MRTIFESWTTMRVSCRTWPWPSTTVLAAMTTGFSCGKAQRGSESAHTARETRRIARIKPYLEKPRVITAGAAESTEKVNQMKKIRGGQRGSQRPKGRKRETT